MTTRPKIQDFGRYPTLTGAASQNPADKTMNVDGSTMPQVFKLRPRLDLGTGPLRGKETHLSIERMIVFIEDSGNFRAGGFGAIYPALANGVNVAIFDADDDALIQDLCDGIDITSNAEWSSKCFDVDYFDFGSGSNFLSARWTFGKSGSPLTIHQGQYLGITINDDLRDLILFRALFQGVANR